MKYRATAMGLGAGILFGVATPLSKVLLGAMNGFQLAGLLYLGAAAAFLPFMTRHWKRELAWIRVAKNKATLVGIVVFGGLLGPVFLMLGLKAAASSSVSIWLNMELVATAVLGVLFFKDHLDRPAVAGVALTLAAGVVVSAQDGFGSLVPALLVTMACFSWGVDNHLTAVVDGASPQTITFIKGLFAGTTNVLIGSFLPGSGGSIGQMGLALLLGVISYGLSIVLYVGAAQRLGATRSQILFSTGPFWGILVAFVALKEPVSWPTAAAMALVATGIVLTNVLSHEHDHSHPAVTHAHAHDHRDGHHGHGHDEGEPARDGHSHLHSHDPQTHSHKHYPDIHHRHAHAREATQ